MSQLQLGLLGIGILVVVAVFAYNKFQEVKLKRQSEQAFGSRHDDVLLSGGSPAARAQGGPLERIEPTLSTSAATPAAASGGLDSRIDFVATLETEKVTGGEAVSSAIVDSLAKPGKPVAWEGYNAESAAWEPLATAGSYGTLRAGLQLADRNGAASEKDFADFDALVHEVAEALGASCDLPEAAAALQRAQQLDALCAEVDVQIGLNLIARAGAIPGTRIRAFAEAQGLALERDGRFRRRDEGGLELFTLANMQPPTFSADSMKTLSTSALTLLIDVARAPGGISAFDRFVEFARALADAVSAAIVDDNRRTLDEAALGRIRAQLQALYASMEQQGVAAGSPSALRLFS